MAFVRHLQVTLRSATFMDPLSISMDERMVYVKASHKNIVYTTNVVEGIGGVELHHMWVNDGTNVFYFAYEDNSEDITLELFNRDHIFIGISRLHLAEFANVMPEQDPELKTLPVSALGRRWCHGSLALTAQIKRQQAMGKLGNLNVVLQEGIINSISSTEPRVFAKLIYKHTTYTIGILRGERNNFVWHEHFTFRINSWEPVDVLEICIYYGAFQVGECKVLLSLFINLEEDLQADQKDFVIRTEDLLVDNRSVGSIRVAGSFSTLHELDVLRVIIKGKRPEVHPPRMPLPESPGLTNYASITNEIRGEDKIEADIFHTDKSKSEVQLESKEIRNAGKPTSIGDYLPIDLTRDLLGASSRGYVIRTICPDGQGGWYSCALKRINTMDESEPDLARLCHPHVVHLFHHWKKKIDYGEVREWMPKSAFMTFLMMELMDGDLGNLMTSIKTTGLPPFSLLVAVHVMLQIAKGMLYLHEMGVSHPHLNCNNVLCRVKSTAQIPFRVGDVLVKLGGFGCSRAANDDTKNRDVFCFGLTCLEILTGDECFEDIYGTDKVSRPSIPESTPFILKDCIASCLDTKITFSEAITLLLLAQSQIIQTCEDKIILCSVNLHIKSTLSNKQDLASSSTSKSDRHEMFHVHQLHPQLGQKATSAQITLIFFHGFPKVSEEWRMTWLTRDNRLVWPQMWLPEDLDGDIRVLSVSFDDRANVSSIQSIKDLLQILVLSATCKLGETDQAIVLVGHSFGGVIIKALVVAAQGLAGKTVENNVEFREVLKCKIFLKRLACIVFYSVPHAFANMEFENYISGCSNTRVLQRSLLLKDLRRDSVFISDMIQLSRDFENAVPRKTKRLAFLEGKPMSKKSLLVTENSCERLSLRWECHKIDRDNHFEVCRPVSKSHIGYKVLLNHLQQLMCSLSAVKGNIDGESKEEPLRLLSRIVQTYYILASPGPFCCPASDEVLADLDGIVQCVPDSIKGDGKTFSKLFRTRANGRFNIREMNALVQKVTDFLDTSGSEFDRMVNDPEAEDIHLQSPSNFEDATLKSKRNFLRRMRIVAKTVDLYNKKVKNIEFLGLVGEENAGKSTFIKNVIERVGAAQDSGVPKVGFDYYIAPATPYKLRDQFYLVEFPGIDGSSKYADAWAQFTALPSSYILLLTFTGDRKKQVQMYKRLQKDLDSKIAVVFNKVDQLYKSRYEKYFHAKYFENHRMKSAKLLGCDAQDVHYVCSVPDREERLTKLRTVGVLGFDELAYKLGEWLGRHSDSESHRVLLDCLKTPVHERAT